MPLAIDTILGRAVNPGATATALTMATGDSLTVRNYVPPAMAYLEKVHRAGVATSTIQIKSPTLHDNVEGIQYISPETPSQFFFPKGQAQVLRAQDNLTVTTTGGTNETDIVSLSIYYTDLPGIAARLHMPADISPLIQQYKILQVAMTTSATAGQWQDTVITTTEDLLIANRDYAVLGYLTDVAVGLVGVKGIDTGNLRVAGPGTASSRDTTNFFLDWSEREGRPHVPVINSANKGSIFATAADSGASTAVKVQLYLALLSTNLPN